MELRAEFNVSRVELDDVERGAPDPDLPELDEAIRQIALGENVTVFHGHQSAGLRGITESTSHEPVPLDRDVERSPDAVARAVDTLRQAGIDGPYGLALCPDTYTRIVESAEYGGHLLFDHLREILGGPLVWAPASMVGSCSASGVGTSSSIPDRTSPSATSTMTPMSSGSTLRRASASGCSSRTLRSLSVPEPRAA